MNASGVAASALGNHDLDQGPGEFAGALASEASGGVTFPGTRFPYLAANVDFSGEPDLVVGADGSDSRLLGGTVAGSAVFRIGDEVIGLVGAATPQLPSITTTGDLAVAGSVAEIAELAAAVQPAVDTLTDAGVDKIIVLAHLQQLKFEKALAAELTDVDIIVAGGSNTRMGDETDALYPGDASFAEGYPFETTVWGARTGVRFIREWVSAIRTRRPSTLPTFRSSPTATLACSRPSAQRVENRMPWLSISLNPTRTLPLLSTSPRRPPSMTAGSRT